MNLLVDLGNTRLKWVLENRRETIARGVHAHADATLSRALASAWDALPDAKIVYARGAPTKQDDTSGFAEAVAAARQSDVAILFLGEDSDMSGEASSRTDIGLPGVDGPTTGCAPAVRCRAAPDGPSEMKERIAA